MKSNETNISGITELRDDLLRLYQEARIGQVEKDLVKEVTNVAGKIIKSAKTQLDYNSFMGSKTPIPFLEK